MCNFRNLKWLEHFFQKCVRELRRKKKKRRVSPSKSCKPNPKQFRSFGVEESSSRRIQRRKASRRRINRCNKRSQDFYKPSYACHGGQPQGEPRLWYIVLSMVISKEHMELKGVKFRNDLLLETSESVMLNNLLMDLQYEGRCEEGRTRRPEAKLRRHLLKSAVDCNGLCSIASYPIFSSSVPTSSVSRFLLPQIDSFSPLRQRSLRSSSSVRVCDIGAVSSNQFTDGLFELDLGLIVHSSYSAIQEFKRCRLVCREELWQVLQDLAEDAGTFFILPDRDIEKIRKGGWRFLGEIQEQELISKAFKELRRNLKKIGTPKEKDEEKAYEKESTHLDVIYNLCKGLKYTQNSFVT
ncbi:hypothetical protein LXL04_029976 [Taraxacum kok-saghyz]